MMTRPLLCACYFSAKHEPDGQYDRLARVLGYTAHVHCPDWDVRIDRIDPQIPAPATGNPSHAWNTAKLDWWANTIDACPDGSRVVLMDADMFLLRSLTPIWETSFDLAYTARDSRTSRLPLNGGLVAVRVSLATKAAIRRWQHTNDAMCRLGTKHAQYHRKYAGMNQASFGCLLDEGGFAGLVVRALPCQEWNCCEWGNFSSNTRVVHVKSRLRRAVFASASSSFDRALLPLVAQWRELEHSAVAHGTRVA